MHNLLDAPLLCVSAVRGPGPRVHVMPCKKGTALCVQLARGTVFFFSLAAVTRH
jgi:hypothetical protein